LALSSIVIPHGMEERVHRGGSLLLHRREPTYLEEHMANSNIKQSLIGRF
jgi:hypothetical protein